MKKLLLLSIFILNLCHVVLATESLPLIQLDSLEKYNLLPGSNLLLDKQGELDLSQAQQSPHWKRWQQEQFQLGKVRDTVWVRQAWRTVGISDKSAILAFSRIISTLDISVYEDGQRIVHEYRDSNDWYSIGFISTNKNIIRVDLKPNKQYELYIRINSSNSIIGDLVLWDELTYRDHDHWLLTLFVSYALMVFLVVLYNAGVFLVTRHKAFIFHAVYCISIPVVQATQYGYFDKYLNNFSFLDRELISVLGAFVAYSAVMGFFMAIVDHKRVKKFYYWGVLVIVINFASITIYPFIGFKTTFMIFYSNIAFGMLLGVVHSYYLFKKHIRDAIKLNIFIVLLLPSIIVLIMNRGGFIKQTFFSEHMILLLVVVDMIIISIILFGQIKLIRQESLRSRYFDQHNQLPNTISLRRCLQRLEKENVPYALTYLWFWGFERMEIARGTNFKNTYLRMFAELTEKQLTSLELLIAQDLCKQPKVFYCEKNTLALVTKPLDLCLQQQLQTTIFHILGTVKQENNYTMEINPVIASSNAYVNQRQKAEGVEKVIQNTNVALSQCIQQNESLLLYNDKVGFRERRRVALMNDFEPALRKGEFYLEWQPQINAGDKCLAGLEVLVRWSHPVYGKVSPAHFIPMLEQDLRITRLSIWVIHRVFADIYKVLEHYPNLDISINLSIYDLMARELMETIDNLCLEAKEKVASNVIFEVTESVHMEDNKVVQEAVRNLQQRGFRFSIDDFGAGYASFGYLQDLPVDEIKIDRRYTEAFTEKNSQAIVQSIIDLAHRLNMQIVVEGIENTHQQNAFTDWGVHRLQGWQSGRPMSLEKVYQLFPVAVQNTGQESCAATRAEVVESCAR